MENKKTASRFVFFVMILFIPAACAGDSVDFVNARSRDGKLNAQAQSHRLEYLSWSDGALRGADYFQSIKKTHSGPAGNMVGLGQNRALSFSMKASKPGEYSLIFSKLLVHRVHDGGRKLAVYISPKVLPHAIISKLLPDGDSSVPLDYTLKINLDRDAIKNGRVSFMLKATTWASCYLCGVKLVGPESSDEISFDKVVDERGRFTEDAIEHKVSYVTHPEDRRKIAPWNFGPRGAGFGVEGNYGYVRFILSPKGIGTHRLSLHGIKIPKSVLPGFTVLKVNGHDVISGSLKNGTFSTKITVTPKQFEENLLYVSIRPVIKDVYVKGASLVPAGKLGKFMNPAKLNKCVIWPLLPFSGFRLGMLPPAPLPKPLIAMSGARNEWVHACWMVGNYIKSNPGGLKVKFKLSDLVSSGGDRISADSFRMQTLLQVGANSANTSKVWQGLRDQDYVDVPSGKPRQMWLVSRISKQAKPGLYKGTLRCSWKGGKKKFRIKLKVYDFQLPDESPLAVNCWRSIYYPLSEKYRQFMKDYYEHYGNVTGTVVDRKTIGAVYNESGDITEPFDTTVLKKIVGEARKLKMRYFLAEFHANSDHFQTMQWLGNKSGKKLPRLKWGSVAQQKVVKEVLRELSGVFNEAGFDNNHWFMYPFDEYLGPKFVKVGKLIKSADPTIKMFSNRADGLRDMKAAAPYIGAWCPHFGQIASSDTQAERMAFMKASGKPVWAYNCTGWRGNDALSFYRRQSWFAFKWGLDGIGTWKYIGDNAGLTGYASEVDQDEEKYGPVVWSPRLFAWTDGIEDHMYLTMLDRFCKENPDSKKSREIKKLLDCATKEVLRNENSPEVYEKWHVRLGRKIEDLGIKRLKE